MTGFVNRADELDRLDDLFDADRATLGVVYGRRRLGKTRLVKKALEDHGKTVFYQARQKTAELQIEQFVEVAAAEFPAIEDIRPDWERLFRYLGNRDAIVVLDEFPYLIEQDESLPSVLQALFDHAFDASSPTFVLVGSSISMMEEATLLGDSPLYGRTSMKLDIRPLSFGAATEFLPTDISADEAVRAWSVFGGVPYYLEELNEDRPLGENIQRLILTRHGSLRNEPEYVLRMELTEPLAIFRFSKRSPAGQRAETKSPGRPGSSTTSSRRTLTGSRGFASSNGTCRSLRNPNDPNEAGTGFVTRCFGFGSAFCTVVPTAMISSVKTRTTG